MEDFIRPIGPVDRDVNAVHRVERAPEERDQDERRREPPPRRPQQDPPEGEAAPEGPVEGDDGHLHVDIRA